MHLTRGLGHVHKKRHCSCFATNDVSSSLIVSTIKNVDWCVHISSEDICGEGTWQGHYSQQKNVLSIHTPAEK